MRILDKKAIFASNTNRFTGTFNATEADKTMLRNS